MITAAQRAELLKNGVHPETLKELRPQDVQNILGGEPVLVAAQRRARARAGSGGPPEVPEQPGSEPSAIWAERAQAYVLPGDQITAALVDAIRAGAGTDGRRSRSATRSGSR